MNVKLDWRGAVVAQRVRDAEVRAVNAALAEGVDRARSNHPGWKTVTGATERAFTTEKARRDGTRTVGELGNSAPHFIFLEIGARGHAGDHTIRRAGDVAGAGLQRRLADELR